MADVGKECTIRMCNEKYHIRDWYKDDDGKGNYLLTGLGVILAWEPVEICTLVSKNR